jgi:hypothetical protein
MHPSHEKGVDINRTIKRKFFVKLVAAIATGYVCVYVVLSFAGTYRPGTIGLNGIKDWLWYPKYFTSSSGKIRTACIYAFLPLFWLDIHYWHNDWTGQSGPRDETLPFGGRPSQFSRSSEITPVLGVRALRAAFQSRVRQRIYFSNTSCKGDIRIAGPKTELRTAFGPLISRRVSLQIP